jgi:hypothetical protein
MISKSEYCTYQRYLSTCEKVDDDPAILFDWHAAVLKDFVEGINNLSGSTPPQPNFIRAMPGQMTIESFIEDIMDALGRVAGTRINHLFAPNSMQQAFAIILLLAEVQLHPWMQHQAATHLLPGQFLATVSHILDGQIVSATSNPLSIPSRLPAPMDGRQLFQ